MSNGGLLEKAMDQQVDERKDRIDPITGAKVDEYHETITDGGASEALVAEIFETPTYDDKESILSSILGNRLYVAIGIGILGFLLSWIFASPSMQSEYAFAGLIPFAMLGGSFYLVWDTIGRKMTVALAAAFLLMGASPFLASSVYSSSITIADGDLSSDSTEISLKIRQSGGLLAPSIESADVFVSFDGGEIWSSSLELSIDREDGYGPYGLITLQVSDFYSGNPVNGPDYTVTVEAGGSSDDYTFDSLELIRTITEVQSEASGYMGTGSDCDSDTENCVIGVILTSWIGLDALGNSRPGGMSYANYNVTATLMEEGDVAVQYPEISVTNGQANWDDSNGEYGDGFVTVGDFGSELPMDGSLSAPEFDRMYISIDDFQSDGGYGCYSFVVEVSQSAPWGGSESVTHTANYQYDKTGDTESWNLVNNC